VRAPTLAPGAELVAVANIADPGAVVCYVGEIPLIVTRRGAAVAAFRNICPHAGYPLQRADGRIVVQDGHYLVCGGHGASFVLASGACAGGPCNGVGLTPVAVIVRDGLVVTA